MPYINIKLTSPMPSNEKLDLVAEKITNLMVSELGKNPERVIINFEEADPDKFYFGAKSVTQIKKANKTPKKSAQTKTSKKSKKSVK